MGFSDLDSTGLGWKMDEGMASLFDSFEAFEEVGFCIPRLDGQTLFWFWFWSTGLQLLKEKVERPEKGKLRKFREVEIGLREEEKGGE